MKNYSHELEHYHPGSKGMCPKCGKKSFTYYIDTETNRRLNHDVGKCDHISSCGYHKPPRDYFKENGTINNYSIGSSKNQIVAPQKPTSYISNSLFLNSLRDYNHNNLVSFLIKQFGESAVSTVLHKYFVGTSKHWPGSTVFWQVDLQGHVRTGNILLYNELTGRRIKEPYNHITWAHSALKLADFQLKQCLFGEHLLVDTNKPIGIVESEKTALISSICIPEFLWLATSGLSNLSVEKCKILAGRDIVLFPDANGFDNWKLKAENLRRSIPGTNIKVSDYIEINSNKTEREEGWDIADYLIIKHI